MSALLFAAGGIVLLPTVCLGAALGITWAYDRHRDRKAAARAAVDPSGWEAEL